MPKEYDKLSLWAVCEKEKVNCRLHINSYCKIEYYLLSSDDSWDPGAVHTWDAWRLRKVSVLQLNEAWGFFPPFILFSVFFLSGLFYICSQRQLTLYVILQAHVLHEITQRTPFVSSYSFQSHENKFLCSYSYCTFAKSYFYGMSLLLTSCSSFSVFLPASCVPSSVLSAGYYSADSHSLLHCNF